MVWAGKFRSGVFLRFRYLTHLTLGRGSVYACHSLREYQLRMAMDLLVQRGSIIAIIWLESRYADIQYSDGSSVLQTTPSPPRSLHFCPSADFASSTLPITSSRISSSILASPALSSSTTLVNSSFPPSPNSALNLALQLFNGPTK